MHSSCAQRGWGCHNSATSVAPLSGRSSSKLRRQKQPPLRVRRYFGCRRDFRSAALRAEFLKAPKAKTAAAQSAALLRKRSGLPQLRVPNTVPLYTHVHRLTVHILTPLSPQSPAFSDRQCPAWSMIVIAAPGHAGKLAKAPFCRHFSAGLPRIDETNAGAYPFLSMETVHAGGAHD